MNEKGYLNQKKLETNAPLRNHPHPKWVRFEIDLPPVRANHTTNLTVVTAHRTPALFVASTAISSVVAVATTMVTLVTMVTMIEMVAVAALAMVAEVVVTIEVSPAAAVPGEVAGPVSVVVGQYTFRIVQEMRLFVLEIFSNGTTFASNLLSVKPHAVLSITSSTTGAILCRYL